MNHECFASGRNPPNCVLTIEESTLVKELMKN